MSFICLIVVINFSNSFINDLRKLTTKERQTSVTDNESKNDGSMHIIQCTGTGPDGKDWFACTSETERIPKKFMDRPCLFDFCVVPGFEACNTSPASNNANITSSFSADSNENYARRDNIRIFGVEEINNEDVFGSVVGKASDLGVTISKQDISVCHCLPPRNRVSRPIVAKFVRSETKFRVMTDERNLKNSFEKIISRPM